MSNCGVITDINMVIYYSSLPDIEAGGPFICFPLPFFFVVVVENLILRAAVTLLTTRVCPLAFRAAADHPVIYPHSVLKRRARKP